MNFIKYLVYKERATQKSYIKYLKKKGVCIGKNLQIVNPRNTYLDVQRPWLLSIGDDVIITNGVTILTHGFDWAVIMRKQHSGEMYPNIGETRIGNNVFIGTFTVINPGCKIGNNVIIGANSVVTKSFPDDVVIAGNPARVIMTLEEYRKKRETLYLKQLKMSINLYIKRYNKQPKIDDLWDYPMVFLPRTETKEAKKYLKYDYLYDKFLNTEPLYNGLDELIKECKEEEI